MKSGKIGHVVSITGHEVDKNCNLENVVVLTLKEFQQMQRDLEVLKILKNDLEMMGFSVVDGEIVIDNADFKYVFEKEYYDVHPEVFKKLLEVEE